MVTQTLARKRRRQDFRRQKILDEAEVLLQKKGFEKLKLIEIAAASDLTHSNIYYYFKDVKAIYDEICVRLVRKEVELMLQLLTDDPASIIDIFEERTRYYFERPHLFHLLYDRSQRMDLKLLREEIYPLSAKISQAIEEVLEKGKKEGLVRSEVQSRKFSNLIVLTSNGILATYLGMKRMGGNLKFDHEEILMEASRVLRTSICWE